MVPRLTKVQGLTKAKLARLDEEVRKRLQYEQSIKDSATREMLRGIILAALAYSEKLKR